MRLVITRAEKLVSSKDLYLWSREISVLTWALNDIWNARSVNVNHSPGNKFERLKCLNFLMWKVEEEEGELVCSKTN